MIPAPDKKKPGAAAETATRARAEDNQPQDSAELQTSAPTAEKAKANLKVEAARLGAGLYELASGGFLLTRWGMARELGSLQEVAALLRQMGGMR